MKNYIIKIFKIMLLQIISFVILVGTIVFAVSWPNGIPDSEIEGGSFMNYFNNMRKIDCPVGQGLKGFDDNFNKICVDL